MASSAQIKALEALEEYLSSQRNVVDHMYIVAIAILCYDYFLNLGREIRLVWPGAWNYTKILYLLGRYVPMIAIYFLLYNQILMGTSPKQCGRSLAAVVWLFTVSITASDVVLTIRTWAVWHRDKKIGILLAYMILQTFTTSCVCNALFIKAAQISAAPYPGFRGCFVTKVSGVMLGDWITLTLLDAVVLTLMTVSAFKAWRSGDRNRFSNVVHREGIVSYIYLGITTIANMVCLLTLNPEMSVMLIPLQACLYSTLSCRIVLNIRELAHQTNGSDGFITELHKDYDDSANGGGPDVHPMEFSPRTTGMGEMTFGEQTFMSVA